MWCKMVLCHKQGENSELIGFLQKKRLKSQAKGVENLTNQVYRLLPSSPPDPCLHFLMGNSVCLIKFTHHPASIMSIFKAIKIMPALVSNAMHQFKVQASVMRL